MRDDDALPASAFGAPHRRDRLWIVAYPAWDAETGAAAQAGTERQRTRASGQPSGAHVADADRSAWRQPRSVSEALPQPGTIERPGRRGSSIGSERESESLLRGMADGLSQKLDGGLGADPWAAEWPGVPRVAYGIPNRVDRLRALGNALVPQIAEYIGRRIVTYEQELAA